MRNKKLNDLSIVLWFLKPYWFQATLLFFLLFVYAFFDTVSLGAIYPLANGVLSGSHETVQYGGRFLAFIGEISSAIPIADKLVAASILLLLVVIVSHLLGVFAESLSLWYHLKLYVAFQEKIYRKLLTNQYSYFHEKKHGELLYIGREASSSVGEMFFYFPKTGIEVFRILILTVLLISISLKYTIVSYAVISVFGVMVYVLSNKVVNPNAEKAQTALSRITAIFSESVSGVRQIKILNNYRYWFSKFEREIELARKLQFRYIAPSYLPPHLMMATVAIIGIGSIIYMRMRMPSEFSELLPIVVVYMGALIKLMPSLSNISHYWMGLKGLGPRLRITFETLVDERHSENDGGEEFHGFNTDIRFDNVAFSYSTRKAVLNDINIRIPKNRVTAIVGESGSGKSTLADLLLRLYTPTSGSIIVDGNDYLQFSIESWLKKVGMVCQDTFVFHASVRENIAAGRASIDDGEVENAAKIADADQFIKNLPNGYDTILGERGVMISGGQRQRIAIARALIGHPELLILDEATSSLDNISEKKVQEAIGRARTDQTTIIVAHRLTSVRNADKIIVLDKGKVVEEGRHEELLDRRGYYYDLYRKQKKNSTMSGGNG